MICLQLSHDGVWVQLVVKDKCDLDECDWMGDGLGKRRESVSNACENTQKNWFYQSLRIGYWSVFQILTTYRKPGLLISYYTDSVY